MNTLNRGKAILVGTLVCVLSCCASAQVVAYWPFGSYGLTDKSGNGNHLALSGTGVSFTEGKVTLDGTQMGLSTANTLNLTPYSQVTIEYWVRVPAVPASLQMIMEQTVDYNQNNGAFYFDLDENNDDAVMTAYRASTGANADITAAGALNDLTWHHVALVLDRTQIGANRAALYFDGMMQGTFAGNGASGDETFSNGTLYIGSRANSSYKFTGDLDDIRITAAALAPAQFMQSRTADQAPGVVAYWPFGANGGADVSGNGNHLAAGGVTFTNGMAQFNGAQTKMQTRLPLDLRASPDMTLEFWMRTTDTTATSMMLVEHTDESVTSPADTGAFYVDANEAGAGSVVSHFRGGDGFNQDMTASALVNDGEWHHVALVYNRDKAGADRSMLFVDGEAQGTRDPFNRDAWGSLRNAYLYLGSRANSSFKFTGDLDDVRISDQALLPSQFMQSRTGDDASVIAYWPFDKGGELSDASGRSHTLAGTGVTFTNGIAVMAGAADLATAASLDLSAYSNLTVECFVRMETPSASPSLLFWHSPAGEEALPGAFALAEEGGLLAGAFRMDSGTNLESSTDASLLTNGVWHHVALVYDAASNGSERVRLYVDRARQTHSPSATDDVLSAFRNAVFGIGGGGFVGALDDVRLVDAALPPEQFLGSHTDDSPRLIAYWSFDRGGELRDASAYSFDLSMQVTDDVVFEEGLAKFTGYSGLFTRSQFDLQTFKAVTVECMVRYTQTNPAANFIELSQDYNGTYGGIVLTSGMLNPGKPGAGYRTSSGYNIDESAEGSISDGEWHHLAYVIDQEAPGAEMTRFYLDGVLQTQNGSLNSTTVTPFVSNQKLYLGWRSLCGSNESDDWTKYSNFTGEMDDIRVTSGALSPAEFMAIAGRTAQPLADDVIAYWPFASGNELADASGHGNVLSGNAAYVDEAAVFDKTRALQTVSAIDLTPYSAVTVEYYIRSRSIEDQIVIEQSPNYNYTEGAFVSHMGGDNMFYAGLAGNVDRSGVGVLSDGHWHHVALVMDLGLTGEAQAELYIDSQPCGYLSSTTRTSFFNGKIFIGMRNAESIGFEGALDDIRITARALRANEFLERPTTALPPVIAYYPFNNRSPLEDVSGNGYSLANSGVTFNTATASAVFDGNQSAFSTLDSLQLSLYEGLTVECFAKFSTTNQMMLLETSAWTEVTPGAFYMFASRLDDGFQELQALFCSGRFMNGSWRWVPLYNYDVTRTLQTATCDGEWHHLALVVNPEKAKEDRAVLYVDGQPQSNIGFYNADREVPFANVPLFIGSRANSSYKFIGELDDVRVTGKALAPSEFLTKRSIPPGTMLRLL